MFKSYVLIMFNVYVSICLDVHVDHFFSAILSRLIEDKVAMVASPRNGWRNTLSPATKVPQHFGILGFRKVGCS
jgi:hypothetical protein